LQGVAKTARNSIRRLIPICSIKYQEALSRQKLIRKLSKCWQAKFPLRGMTPLFVRFQGNFGYYIGKSLCDCYHPYVSMDECIHIHIFINYAINTKKESFDAAVKLLPYDYEVMD
jgi:hypothetical protein